MKYNISKNDEPVLQRIGNPQTHTSSWLTSTEARMIGFQKPETAPGHDKLASSW